MVLHNIIIVIPYSKKWTKSLLINIYFKSIVI